MIRPRAPSATFESVDEFFRAFAPVAHETVDSVERAAEAGMLADRLGYAFAGGYQAALTRLVPALGRVPSASLSATEKGGAHPRTIETELAGGVLRGVKTFATLAGNVETLLVVATEGKDDAGRNRLKLVRLPRSREGVTLSPGPVTPFAPEIAHQRVTLNGVRVEPDEVLPGDGYDDYLKPFRTIEDVHVMAALLGHLVGSAMEGRWPPDVVEDALAGIVSLRSLNGEPAAATGTHLALGGVLRQITALLDRVEPLWASLPEAKRLRWKRDRPLLSVAGGAREKRLAAARATL